MLYKAKPTSGLSPPCLTEANRSLSMERFQIKRQLLAVYCRELSLVPSCSCCLSMTYQIVSWPKQDCLQTTVSSTDLLRLQRTAYSYKNICTDWLSGKTNGGCVSIQKNTACLELIEQDHQFIPYTLISGQILHTDEQSKYLGVDITSNLFWNPHIVRIVKKGNSMLGFLQKNLRVNSRETKASVYFTLVRPNLEYCSNVWSPYTIQAKKRIEMVQRRAARYATNKYQYTSSVTDMLEDLNWDTLETRRTKSQVTMMWPSGYPSC